MTGSSLNTVRLMAVRRQLYSLHGRLLVAAGGEFVRTRYGRIEAPREWIPLHKRSRIQLGLYERDESAFVAEHLDPRVPAIEFGAGIGVVSSQACSRLRPETAYVGVEANPALVAVAQRNIAQFTSSAERTILHGLVGAGESGQTATFTVVDNNFQLSAAPVTEGGAGIEVPIRSLSSIVNDYGFDRFQLISDIEGAEIDLIEHEARAFEACDSVIIELHGPEVTGRSDEIETVARRIEALGFSRIAERRGVFVFRR